MMDEIEVLQKIVQIEEEILIAREFANILKKGVNLTEDLEAHCITSLTINAAINMIIEREGRLGRLNKKLTKMFEKSNLKAIEYGGYTFRKVHDRVRVAKVLED